MGTGLSRCEPLSMVQKAQTEPTDHRTPARPPPERTPSKCRQDGYRYLSPGSECSIDFDARSRVTSPRCTDRRRYSAGSPLIDYDVIDKSRETTSQRFNDGRRHSAYMYTSPIDYGVTSFKLNESTQHHSAVQSNDACTSTCSRSVTPQRKQQHLRRQLDVNNTPAATSTYSLTPTSAPPTRRAAAIAAQYSSSWSSGGKVRLRRNVTFHSAITGHEHPYSIRMSSARNEAKADGAETPVIAEPPLNDNDVQFILRENKKMAKKASFGECDY